MPSGGYSSKPHYTGLTSSWTLEMKCAALIAIILVVSDARAELCSDWPNNIESDMQGLYRIGKGLERWHGLR